MSERGPIGRSWKLICAAARLSALLDEIALWDPDGKILLSTLPSCRMLELTRVS